MIYLDPNSEINQRAAELRSAELRRLGRKLLNLLIGSTPQPLSVNTNEND